MIVRELIVVAVHGEGDRATVNAIKKDQNQNSIRQHHRNRQDPPAHLHADPNENPEVTVILHDAHSHNRLALPLETWDEVEDFKKLAGYDLEKRHWKHGAKVKITIDG